MASRKNDGQQFIPEVVSPPKGMPSADAVQTEALRMGLTREDAQALIDHWLANGFKTGRHTVKDWRAVIRTWKRERWFPSLKNSKDTTTKKTDWSKYRQNDSRNLL
jgi:hypothetical protein